MLCLFVNKCQEITCKKFPLEKFISFDIPLNIFLYHTTNFLKNWFWFLLHTREQKRDKSQFVTKSIEIKVTINFVLKCLSNNT